MSNPPDARAKRKPRLFTFRAPHSRCQIISRRASAWYAAPMKITKLNALRVRIPQKPPIAPYQSRYRATSAKDCLLIRLETDTGLVGWGETPEDWLNKSYEGTPEELLRQQA